MWLVSLHRIVQQQWWSHVHGFEHLSVIGSFTTSVLSSGRVASVACDAVDTLYVGYDADDQGISKYDTVSGTWLAKITSAANGLPTDPVWLDAMDFSNGKLMIGYDDSGGFAIISTRGTITGQASVQQVGTPVTSVKHTGTEWLIGQAGEASGYSRVDKLGTSGLYTAFELPALVSGNIPSMVSDGSKIWVGTESSSGGQGNGGGQGTAGSSKVRSTQTAVSIGRKAGHSRFQQQLVTC